MPEQNLIKSNKNEKKDIKPIAIVRKLIGTGSLHVGTLHKHLIVNLNLSAMKNFIKHLGSILLLAISTMVICSCSELDDDSQGSGLPSNFITPSGGILTSSDGNVTITFPEGAINVAQEFHINTCLDQKECDFLLRPLRIDPVMLFEKPVTVTLRYDGELAVSPIEIPGNAVLTATVWRTEIDFFNNCPCLSCTCSVDDVIHTITFCTCTSGIITIGLVPGTEMQ